MSNVHTKTKQKTNKGIKILIKTSFMLKKKKFGLILSLNIYFEYHLIHKHLVCALNSKTLRHNVKPHAVTQRINNRNLNLVPGSDLHQPAAGTISEFRRFRQRLRLEGRTKQPEENLLLLGAETLGVCSRKQEGNNNNNNTIRVEWRANCLQNLT